MWRVRRAVLTGPITASTNEAVAAIKRLSGGLVEDGVARCGSNELESWVVTGFVDCLLGRGKRKRRKTDLTSKNEVQEKKRQDRRWESMWT